MEYFTTIARLAAAGALAWLLSPVGVQAQSNTGMGIAYPAGGDLNTDALYVVTYQCGPPPGMQHHYVLDDLVKKVSGLFGGSTTETFGFFLHTGDPILKGPTAINDDVAKGFSGADLVYSIDPKTPSNSFFNIKCGGQFIVRGSSRPAIVAFHSYSQTTDTKKVGDAMTTLTSSVNPLLALFTGAPGLVSVATTILTDATTTIKSIAGLVSLTDNNQGGAVVIPLKASPAGIGYAGISTTSASVGVNIVLVPDLLVAPGVPFRDSFSKITQIDASVTNGLLTGDNHQIRDRCDKFAQQWKDAGLTSPLDEAYVLVQQIKDTASKQQIVNCLGHQLGLAALPRLNLFKLRDALWFTLDDINHFAGDPSANAMYGPQPQGWNDLGPTAAVLIRDLNRLGRGITLPTDEADRFKGLFGDNLTVRDDTDDFTVKHDIFPAVAESSTSDGPIAMVGRLTSGGFKNWGCYVETDADLALKSDANEALIMVAWQSKADKLQPLVARILFRQHQIAEFDLTDQISAQAVIAKAGCTPPNGAGPSQ